MAWEPRFPNWAGVLPLLQNAKFIVERDISEALAWAFGVAAPGPVYERIAFTQRHSQVYPLLIIQPATHTPAELDGGVVQAAVFDCEIFLTRAINAGNLSDEIDLLTQDLIRYYDATVMAFISAPAADWRQNFEGDDQGKVHVWCTNAIFGQLQQGREARGEYLHSVAFELQVRLTESQ